MIDVSQLPAVKAQLERDVAAKAGAVPQPLLASNEPPPRQFPLAGQSQPRPLADPARGGKQ